MSIFSNFLKKKTQPETNMFNVPTSKPLAPGVQGPLLPLQRRQIGPVRPASQPVSTKTAPTIPQMPAPGGFTASAPKTTTLGLNNITGTANSTPPIATGALERPAGIIGQTMEALSRTPDVNKNPNLTGGSAQQNDLSALSPNIGDFAKTGNVVNPPQANNFLAPVKPVVENQITQPTQPIQTPTSTIPTQTAPTVPVTPVLPEQVPEQITPEQARVNEINQRQEVDAIPQGASQQVMDSVANAEALVQQAQKISPDELSTQADLDKLIEAAKNGYLNTSQQAIPLEFITGQLKAIEQRALGLAEPLESKLTRLQSERVASLNASEFALERADKKADQQRNDANRERETNTYIDESGNMILFDAQTGETISNLGKQFADKKDGAFTLGKDQQRFDEAGNLVASGVSGTEPGTAPQVDAQGNVVLSKEQQTKVDILNKKIGDIDALLEHDGLNTRVGPTGFTRAGIAHIGGVGDAFGSGDAFAGGVHQLMSQETIDTLISLKERGGTLGALSDQERIMLQNAATKLGGWEVKKDGEGTGKWNIDEKSFKQELNILKALTQKAIERATGQGFQASGDQQLAELRQAGYSDAQIESLLAQQ